MKNLVEKDSALYNLYSRRFPFEENLNNFFFEISREEWNIFYRNFWNIIFRKFVTRISDPFGFPLEISGVSVGCFHWMGSAPGPHELKRAMQNIAGVEIESKEFLRCFDMHVHGMLSTWLPWFAPHSHHILIQSEEEPNSIVTRSYTFFHSLWQFHVFCSRFSWFVHWAVCTFSTYDFGFLTLNSKSL